MYEIHLKQRENYRACAQRTDARIFPPSDEIDPRFGKTLRHAAKQGLKFTRAASSSSKTESH